MTLHPLVNMYDRIIMMRSWLLLMVHSLLGDVISYLLVGLPTVLGGLPTCCQGLCEVTCY
jgi:hypothetical protein